MRVQKKPKHLPIDSIDHSHNSVQSPKGGRIHQHAAPKWGSASRIYQHQPENGVVSLWIKRYT